MQLTSPAAFAFGVTNRFLIEENIRGGVAYLAYLIRQFVGELRLVAAAYYAGETRIQKQGLRCACGHLSLCVPGPTVLSKTAGGRADCCPAHNQTSGTPMRSPKILFGSVCACLISSGKCPRSVHKWRVVRFGRAKSRLCTWHRGLRRRFECRTR
jgi:hypothetical protein